MITKNLLAKLALIVIVGSTLAIPFAAMAAVDQSGNTVSYQPPSLWPTGYWGKGGLVSCIGDYIPYGTGQGQSPVLGNPPVCNNLCDLMDTIINIIYFVMSIAIFIITPLMFVTGAIMIMVSGANPEMLGTGKRILKGTVIGLAIVLCSYLIVATVINVLGITGVGGFGGTASCSIKTS
jgi:hypothetical protein